MVLHIMNRSKPKKIKCQKNYIFLILRDVMLEYICAIKNKS
jgi:hypothetical protein